MKRRDFLLYTSTALSLGASVRAPAAPSLIDQLYTNRLWFSGEGKPLIPVRMMEGQERVELLSAGGLRVELVAEGRIAEVAKDVPLIASRRAGAPAELETLSLLETLEGSERPRRGAALQAWRARGHEASELWVGGVYGLGGTLFDNRACLIVSPAVQPSRAAPPLAADATALTERLVRLPTLALDLKVGTHRLSAGSPTRAALVRVTSLHGEGVTVRQVEHSVGYAQHGFADRELRGEIYLVPDRHGKIAVVNLVPETALLAGILPSEIFASAPMEALKAQAVAARGELFAKIGRRHLGDPYLICSEQHCQVYKGRSAEHPRTSAAVEATDGQMLYLEGHPVDTVYSACCGGHTEAAEVVWERPPSRALRGRPDRGELPSSAAAGGEAPSAAAATAGLSDELALRAFLEMPRESAYCGQSSFNQRGDAFRWQRTFSQAELTRLCAPLGVGEVSGLQVLGRGPGGRLRALRVTGSQGRADVLRELPIRRLLGNLRSGLFVLEESRDAQGTLQEVTLRGAGFGHGVGLCQQGAIGMAEQGADHRTILAHYFMGAEVLRVF